MPICASDCGPSSRPLHSSRTPETWPSGAPHAPHAHSCSSRDRGRRRTSLRSAISLKLGDARSPRRRCSSRSAARSGQRSAGTTSPSSCSPKSRTESSGAWILAAHLRRTRHAGQAITPEELSNDSTSCHRHTSEAPMNEQIDLDYSHRCAGRTTTARLPCRTGLDAPRLAGHHQRRERRARSAPPRARNPCSGCS